MSHKQSKLDRRAVRDVGHVHHDVQLSSGGKLALNLVHGWFTGERILDPNCGRAIYRNLKKTRRNGQVSAAA